MKITAHQAFLTREAPAGIARVNTADILQVDAGGASRSWLSDTPLI